MISDINTTGLLWIESIINKALAYDPATKAAIAELEGSVLLIESKGPPFRIFVLHDSDGITLLTNYEGEPDTALKGTALSLATLALVGQDRVSFFSSGVEVRGSQELLQKVRQILQQLDVDWEAILAKLMGDIPATLLARAFRSAADWNQLAFGRASDVLTGFNQEELQLLPTKSETEQFYSDTQQLKADVDRVGARVARLLSRQQSRENG